MSVGTITWRNRISNYSFQWNRPCSPLKTAKNLNPTQFQMTYRGQLLQRNMTVSVGPVSLFRTSHYFRLLFTRFFHYWDLWHLISSFYADHRRGLLVYDENFSRGLHDRSCGLLHMPCARKTPRSKTQLMMCIQSLLLIFLVTLYYAVQ